MDSSKFKSLKILNRPLLDEFEIIRQDLREIEDFVCLPQSIWNSIVSNEIQFDVEVSYYVKDLIHYLLN